MPVSQFRKFRTEEPEGSPVSRMFDSVDRLSRSLQAIELLHGARVTFSLASGSNTVPHPLNRTFVDYVMGSIDSNATVWKSHTQSNPTKSVTLESTGRASGSLWIF